MNLFKNIGPDLAYKLAFIFAGNLFYGISVGMNMSLTPLLFESHGVSNSVIGMLIAFDLLATLILAPFLPKVTKVIPVGRILVIGLVVRNIMLLVLPLGSSVPYWLITYFIFGGGSGIAFVCMQYWVNSICDNNNRGFGLSTINIALSIGIALGAIVLKPFGLYGIKPFFICSLIGFLVLVPYSFVLNSMPNILTGSRIKLMEVIKSAPIPIIGGIYADYLFFSTTYFLVLFGLKMGLSDIESSMLITYILLGAILSDIPVGLLADRVNKVKMMLFSAIIVFVCYQFLPFFVTIPVMVVFVFMFICGADGGTYICSMALLAEKFQGEKLISANSAFVMMNSIGSISGLLVTGFLMDIYGASGLIISVALSSLVTILILARYVYKRQDNIL